MIELKDVQLFVRVAETGSFAQAAAELRMARPALSRRIGKMEEDSDTKLFLRVPRGVKLTVAGQTFLSHCHRILQEVSSAELALHQSKNNSSAQVALGITPPMAALVAPLLIENIRKHFPHITLRVLAAASGTQIAHLLDGFLDVSFLVTGSIEAFHLPRLKVIPLFTDPLVVVSTPQPQRAQPFYTVEDLTHAPIILNIAAGDLLRQQTPAIYKRLLVECETDSDETVRSLVLSGKGVTLCPRRVYNEDIVHGRMAAFPLLGMNVYVTLGLAYLEDRLSDPVRQIVCLIKSQVQQLLSQGAILSENPSGKAPVRPFRERPPREFVSALRQSHR